MPEFQLPASTDLDRLAEQLTARLGLEPEPSEAAPLEREAVERTFYDTFDGRLYRAARLLVADCTADDTELRLESRGVSSARAITQRAQQVPRFAWDLAPGRLRTELQPLIEMRALLPQLRLRCNVRRLAQRDGNGKTVVRLALEEYQVLDAEQPASLCSRARVEPLKGYGKALRRVERTLERDLGFAPVDTELLSAALATQQRELHSYSSKIGVTLEPEMRADAALKRILAEQYETMKANLEGMCSEVDSEFLHDFRVSVRRTRSALSRIRGVFPSRTVGRFRREFRWLGQLTGPARDYDVYLLDFEDLRSQLPQGLGEHLEPLRALLTERRADAYEELRVSLRARPGSRLLSDWGQFVSAPVPKQSSLANACRPIGDVASGEIWRAYKRASRQGDAIGEDGPAAELHELRKRCKALRYLLEFFRSLYPADDVGRVVAELKALQKILGAFQDLEVQSMAAARWGLELADLPDVGPQSTLALGALTQQLSARQDRMRGRFQGAYERFSSKDNRMLARSLFRARKSRNRP
jgi:CHAD domain-containing protein